VPPKEGLAKAGMALFDLPFLWDGYHEKAAKGSKTVYICRFLRPPVQITSKFSLDSNISRSVFCPSQKYLH
jgi:hypothetical protein